LPSSSGACGGASDWACTRAAPSSSNRPDRTPFIEPPNLTGGGCNRLRAVHGRCFYHQGARYCQPCRPRVGSLPPPSTTLPPTRTTCHGGHMPAQLKTIVLPALALLAMALFVRLSVIPGQTRLEQQLSDLQ